MGNKHNHVDENKFGLRACPFCGLAHTVVYSQENAVECYECDIYGPSYLDKSKAVAAWNSRPLEDALTAEVTALRARVDELEDEARWVPVGERLPEVDASTPWTSVEVAVFDGTAVISPAFYYFSDGSPLFGYKAKDWRSGNETVQGVTHWRYIKPPEAE